MTTHTADVKFIASDSWKTRTKSYMFRWYFKLLVNRTWFRVWLAYCHFFNGLNYLVMMSCGAAKLPAGKGDSFCTNWAAGRFGPQPAGPMRARQGGIAKMKLEMPRSFTDHPLSRKVEHLKSYAKIYCISSENDSYTMPLAGTGIVRRWEPTWFRSAAHVSEMLTMLFDNSFIVNSSS